MKKILVATVFFVVIGCVSKSFVVSQKGETVRVYFKGIEGRYGQLVDKTQFYLFRDSEGWVVPVEDSLEAEYYIDFSINASFAQLKNPDVKVYEVVVKVKSKKNSSIVGMSEARDKGNWNAVVTSLSKELSGNLVAIFNGILEVKAERIVPPKEPEKEEKIEDE